MLALKQLPRETNRDFSMRVLRRGIVTLEMQPGRMYSEKELAASLGLSRMPMREALIELAKTRIVEVHPQRGTAVTLIDYELVNEACFIRETLETEVIALCCERREDQLLARMALNVRQQRNMIDGNHTDELMLLDNSFHRALFTMAGKQLSYEMMSDMTIHFDRVRSLAVEGGSDFQYINDHERMIEAIRAHEADQARALMHLHLHRYEFDAVALQQRYPAYFKKQA